MTRLHLRRRGRVGTALFETSGGESFDIQLRICKANGLRTNELSPALIPVDYLASELQQHCVPNLVIGVPQLNCKIQKGNCSASFGSDEVRVRVRAYPVVLAIAAAVVLVAILMLAAWAPADLLIEDSVGFTVSDLDALTGAELPTLAIAEFVSQQGIKVKVVPLEKIPTQYRERREYRSDEEDSRYEIVLRYNHVA